MEQVTFFLSLSYFLQAHLKISLVSHSPHHLSSSTSLIFLHQISHSSNELGFKGRQLGVDLVARLGQIFLIFFLVCIYLVVCSMCVNVLCLCQATAKLYEISASTTLGPSSSALPMIAISNSGTLRQVGFTSLISTHSFQPLEFL